MLQPDNSFFTRKLLPTKEEIFVIEDINKLISIRDETEAAQKKICVDLEFSNRNEEWAKRARGALTAHDICLTNIARRIKLISGKGGVQQELAAKQQLVKAEKKQAHATTVLAQQQIKETRLKEDAIRAQNRLCGIIEKTSYFAVFHKIARQKLTSQQIEEIEKIATELHLKNLQEVGNGAA